MSSESAAQRMKCRQSWAESLLSRQRLDLVDEAALRDKTYTANDDHVPFLQTDSRVRLHSNGLRPLQLTTGIEERYFEPARGTRFEYGGPVVDIFEIVDHLYEGATGFFLGCPTDVRGSKGCCEHQDDKCRIEAFQHDLFTSRISGNGRGNVECSLGLFSGLA